MKVFFKVLSVLCVLTQLSFAQTFINFSAEPSDSFNAVLVEKSGKWLHVINVSEGTAKVLESFQVLTGGAEGDKLVQGDEKTPEGLYFVTGFISPEKLRSMYGEEVAKQYGTGAYPLSYPNLKDRLGGKTGGGIWLHGVDPERLEPVTKGCVAFDNEKLNNMNKYIQEGTPVIITDEGMQGAVRELREHFQEMKKVITDYIYAWESNVFEDFGSFYHSQFRSTKGQGLKGYLSYKKTLMDYYPYRRVHADSFRIFSQNEKESVAEFDQYYCAANVFSYGTKKLYLEEESGRPKIIAEEFRQKDSTPFVRAMVNKFIIDWKNSWESLDIDKYMKHYSEDFATKGMNKAAWESDKAGKFEDLKSVKVQIDGLSYNASSPVSFTIEFKQSYEGDTYSDVGVKTLRVEGCPGDFKIISEHWRAM
ncbi:MAG: hypothetical protein C0602_04870 [Denitrovibrio sp.]|nr:MAG: hypothetical protein C0602_04870 [Denitrovibrio sp.]